MEINRPTLHKGGLAMFFSIVTCHIKTQCYIFLSSTYNWWLKVHSHTVFISTLMLAVNGPLKQLWRQGAPLPFSLTVVSTNKLTLTCQITNFATIRLP